MAEHTPLIMIGGQLQQLPAGDTVITGTSIITVGIEALYWRIGGMVSTGAVYAFSEIEFRNQIGGSATVPDAVTSTSQYAQFSPANAIDGNHSTLFASGSKGADQYFTAQFSTAINVAEIEITARTGGSANQTPTVFTLEYSDDGTTWLVAGETTEEDTVFTPDESRTFNVAGFTTTTATAVIEALPEAPLDGENYVRKDGEWVIAASAGSADPVIFNDWQVGPLLNGNWETGDATHWNLVTGAVRVEEWSDIDDTDTAGMTTEANGTYYFNGGSSLGGGPQAEVEVNQIVLPTAGDGVSKYRVTAQAVKDFADADDAQIKIELLDVDDNVISTDEHTSDLQAIGIQNLSVTLDRTAATTQIRVTVNCTRNAGTSINAGIDNVVLEQLTASGSGATLARYSYNPFNNVDDLVNITPVIGGGTILRNTGYSGPALRVAHANTTAETDVFFDGFGKVSGTRPYGNDTRVIIVYDQWGSDHFKAAKTAGILIIENDDTEHFNWQISFNSASAGLFTDSVGSEDPAWKQPNPLWAIGYKRMSNVGLEIIHGAESSSGFMASGIWREANDIHWRINGSSQIDWFNTNWSTDVPASQAFSSMIGDATQTGNAGFGYFNNEQSSNRGYLNPIDTYTDTTRYGWGDGDFLGEHDDGITTELHIFSSSAPATTDEITYVDNCLNQTKTVTTFTVGTGVVADPMKINFLAPITGDYTLISTDFVGNQIIDVIAAENTTVTLTIPLSVSGTEIATFVSMGAGTVTFAAGAGVTLIGFNDFYSIAGIYASCSLIPKGNNTYLILGALQ